MIIPLHAWSSEEIESMVFHTQQLQRRRTYPPPGLRPNAQAQWNTLPDIRERSRNQWNTAFTRLRVLQHDEVPETGEGIRFSPLPRRNIQGNAEAEQGVLHEGEQRMGVWGMPNDQELRRVLFEGEEREEEQSPSQSIDSRPGSDRGNISTERTASGTGENNSELPDDEGDSDGWDTGSMDSGSSGDWENPLSLREMGRQPLQEGSEQVVGRLLWGGDSAARRLGYESARALSEDMGGQVALLGGSQGLYGETTTCPICGYIELYDPRVIQRGPSDVCGNCATLQGGADVN